MDAHITPPPPAPRVWLRRTVAGLPPYRSPGTLADYPQDIPDHVRLLHLNESPFGPAPGVAEAVARAATQLNRYPDPLASALTAELARRTGVPASRIVLGAGTEDLIRLLADLSLDPGDEAVVPAPSFPLFAAAARLRDAVPVRVPLDPQGANDTTALLRAVTPRTRLLFCCTPNPPSGGATATEAVVALARDLPPHILLVLDEAYGEFARHAGYADPVPDLLRRLGPWVVLRTFSKAYALAGLRVGYALCGSAEVAEALRKVRLAYSPSVVAQAAALAALQDDAHLTRSLTTIAGERAQLAGGLAALGLAPYPSVTNFVSVALPIAAASAVEALRQRCILVRDWRDPDHKQEIRITVGTPDDTAAVLRALRDILDASA